MDLSAIVTWVYSVSTSSFGLNVEYIIKGLRLVVRNDNSD
jgi:hypothetical protein